MHPRHTRTQARTHLPQPGSQALLLAALALQRAQQRLQLRLALCAGRRRLLLHHELTPPRLHARHDARAGLSLGSKQRCPLHSSCADLN